ncbi:unnamed protein product, partial [Porites evermanni]
MSFYSTLIHDAGTDSHALFKTIDRPFQRKPDKRLPYCSSSISAFFKVKMDNLRTRQVKSLCKSAFYQMRNIARIRRYLSPKTTELLIHAFVSSKLDFCNSLLYGILK